MGLGSLEVICHELRAHGLTGETPLALIEQGTTARQRLHVGTLDALPVSLSQGQCVRRR